MPTFYNPRVPEWASFFDTYEYSDFINAIDNYFRKKEITYELGDGMLTAGANDFGLDVLGLSNVAQVCRQDNPKNYNNIVSGHFDAMIRANIFANEFKMIVHDVNKIKKYIGVRLYANDYVSHVGKECTMGKEFIGDIYAMLVFDLPDSIISILPEQAEKWGKNLNELFDIGLQNIKNNYPLDISQQQFNEFEIWFIQGEHFFAPNIIFDLKNHPKLIGSKGSLIAIPHRHSVIIYPIENIETLTAINHLIPTIFGMYAEGPGSISNCLFWYIDGNFENLPYTIKDDKVQFFPPDNFVDLLNTLSEKQ